ncbi:MAG: spheroidene monooxygenase [Actinomycetota bacterium]
MIAVIYLWRADATQIPRALWHMAIDRRTLKKNKAIHFFKLLGTGTGETFTPRDADPTLWGLLVTIDEKDLLEFDSGSVVNGWRKFSKSESRYVATPLSSHGQWSGAEPFEVNFEVKSELKNQWDGKVLALTRARIKWRKSFRFWGAVPSVISSLQGSAGLESAIGIGEAPIGLQGTLSIWTDNAALKAFAYQGAAHSAVIHQTQSEGWYSEELFARFALLEVRGSITIDK